MRLVLDTVGHIITGQSGSPPVGRVILHYGGQVVQTPEAP
jgi:hypothetical protein